MNIDFQLINKILVIFTNLLAVWLSFWVYLADKKSKTNRGFFILVIPNLLWIDSYYIASTINNIHLSLFLTRLTFAFTFIFFITLYYFFVIWFSEKTGKYIIFGKFLIVYELLFGMICAFTDLILPKISVGQYGIIPIFSTFGKITFHISVAVMVVLVIAILVSKYFKSSTQIRQKIQYFLLGIFIFLITNFIIGVILPILFNIHDYYYITSTATIVFLSFTAYAIVKSNLFDVKIIITSLFVGITTILLAIDTYFFVHNPVLHTFKIIALIGYSCFGYFLIKNVQNEITQRKKLEELTQLLETKSNDLSLLLADSESKSQDVSALLSISQIGAISLRADQTIQKMMDFIPTLFGNIGYIGGIMALKNSEKNKTSIYLITQNKNTNEIGKLINKNIDEKEGDKNLLLKTIQTKSTYTSDKLSDIFDNNELVVFCNSLQKKIGIKSIASVPVIHLGQIKGVVVFILKKKDSLIDQRDKKIMTNFANQLGSVLTNSQLFEEISNDTKKLQKINTELSEMLESKSTFLSVASHQLRTPVSIAKGMLSMVVDGIVKDDKKDLFIKRSLVAVERLSEIIHDLLSANAVESSKYTLNKEATDIEAIIEKTIKERQEIVQFKKLKLIFNKSRNLVPKLFVDPTKTREVISNLIDNAIQYTPNGDIEINTFIKDNKFYFEIKDSGIGIAKEDMKKLFKKLSRLTNAIAVRPDGSGLGLYLVKKIIKAHKGNVIVRSEGINKGSTFTLFLPIVRK
jgi:signal transduction histidine kinase